MDNEHPGHLRVAHQGQEGVHRRRIGEHHRTAGRGDLIQPVRDQLCAPPAQHPAGHPTWQASSIPGEVMHDDRLRDQPLTPQDPQRLIDPRIRAEQRQMHRPPGRREEPDPPQPRLRQPALAQLQAMQDEDHPRLNLPRHLSHAQRRGHPGDGHTFIMARSHPSRSGPSPQRVTPAAACAKGECRTIRRSRRAPCKEVGERAVTGGRRRLSPSSPPRWRGQRRSGASDRRPPGPGVRRGSRSRRSRPSPG